VLIQQDDWIQQNRTQCQQLAPLQAFGQPLTTPGTDVFEHAVERLNRQRTSRRKNPADFDAPISMGIRATPRGDQCTGVQRPVRTPLGGVVMGVPEDIPPLQRPWLSQLGGAQMVGVTGAGTLRGQGEPATADDDRQRQLPAVPPAMIPGLTPGGVGVHRGGWDCPGQPMFRVPDAAVSAPRRTSDGGRVSLRGPGRPQRDPRTPQTAKQRGPPRRQGLTTSFPGTPRGKPSVLRQQGTTLACHGIVLCQNTAQGLGRREPPNNHDDERLDKKLVGRELLPPARAFDEGRRRGYRLDEPEEADQDAAMGEHCSASGVGGLATAILPRPPRSGQDLSAAFA
jgi:hypothetical protein